MFLSGNNFSDFPLVKLFQSCRELAVLDLFDNQLDHRTINEEEMNHSRELKTLKLSNNQLENIEFVCNFLRTYPEWQNDRIIDN